MAKKINSKIVEIKGWLNGEVLHSCETESMRDAVASAIANRADLRSADLRSANLRYANLSYANLRSADLRSADLRYANLRYANLSYANLSYANLSYANLSYADLRYANLSYADLPAPTMILLASWCNLSPQLVADLMLFDSTCHPDPTAFDRWAVGGDCPYSGVHVQRAVNFPEDKSLWGKGVPCRPYDLMTRVLAEVCPDWTEEQRAEFEKKFEEAKVKK